MTPYEISSLMISLIAIALSLYAAINTYYEKHIKTRVHLRWVHLVSNELQVSLLVTNMASRPSTLTKVCLHYNNDVTESAWHPSKIIEAEEKPPKTAWADVTPINIPARSAQTVILAFQYLNNFQLGNTVHLSFVINATEFDKTFEVKRVLDSQDIAVALDYRSRHS